MQQFRHDCLMTQQVQLDPNNVPPQFIPRLNLPNVLMQYLPALTAFVINNISANATANAVRVFTFNQISENNFMNVNLQELVSLAAKTLAVAMVETPNIPLQQQLNDAITLACLCWVSRNLQINNYLMQYMDPQDVNKSQQFLNLLNDVNNKATSYYDMIQNRTQGTQQPQYQQPMQQQPYSNGGSFINNGFNNGHMQQQRPMQPDLRVNSNTYDRYSANTPVGNGGSNFNTNNNVVSRATLDATPSGRRYAERHQEPIVAPKVEVVNTFMDKIIDQYPDSEYSASDWIPTYEQPYKTLISKFSHEVEYKKTQLGNKEVVIETVKPKGVGMMDRELHRTGSLSGAKNVFYSTSDRLDQLHHNLSNFNIANSIIDVDNSEEDIMILEADNQIKVTDYVNRVWGTSTTLADAILEGRQKKFCNTKDNDVNVYRYYALVAYPHFYHDNYQYLMKDLNGASTFKQMGAILARAITALTESASITSEDDACDLDIFLATLDTKLTKFINDFLKVRISLDITIDKFSEDIFDVKEYLEGKSPLYSKAYDVFEMEVMGNLFPILDKEVEESLQLLAPLENTTFITQTVSMTFIDILSKELDFSVAKGEPYVIKESVTPWLHDIASNVFAQSGYYSTTNLIITKDNKQYQLYKGLIGNDVYLIVAV